MSKHRTDLTKGVPLPSTWVNVLMEFIGSLASNFQITQPSNTTVSIPAGTDNDQVAIAINGRWRFNTAAVTATHPGGAAGTYDVYVTASDNDWSASDPADNTVYTFGLVVRATGSPPATALYRRVATCVWDGVKITAVFPLIQTVAGQRAPLSPEANLRTVRGYASGPGVVLAGAGWTVVRNGAGDYTVTFTAAFSGTPAVAPCPVHSGENIGFRLYSVSASQFRLIVYQAEPAGSTNVDSDFTFIAEGPT